VEPPVAEVPSVEPAVVAEAPAPLDVSTMSTPALLAAAVALTPTEPEPSAMALRSAAPEAASLSVLEEPNPPALTLPVVELPEYPSVPGATPSQVAAVVVIFLATTLQSALEGGMPFPVTVPLYLMLVAAYTRLEQLAYNNTPTITGYTTPTGLLNLATGKVLATDQDGDALQYSIASQPTSGIASILPDGTFAYTATGPLALTGGTDTFTVAVDDMLGIQSHFYAPNGHVSTIEVTVTVPGFGVNLGPTIESVTYTDVNTGTGVVKGKVVATDREGDAITFSGTSLSGSIDVDAEGNFTFTPTATARHAASLPVLPVNTALLSFTATDAQGASTLLPTTLVVPVVPFNAAPTATLHVNEPGLLGVVTGYVTPQDSDLDLVTVGPLVITTSKGAVVVTPVGLFTYTPTAAARHDAASTTMSGAGTDTFTLTLSDGHGGSVDVPVTVTISSTNTAPTGIAVPDLFADQIGAYRGAVLGTDFDLDSLTYRLTNNPTGSSAYTTRGGIAFLNADGTFTYVPSAAAPTVAGIPLPFTDTFGVTIDDGHGGTTIVTVSVSENLKVVATNGAADPTDGKVVGSLNIPAGDLGLLTYGGGVAPTKGTLTVTGTGYSYVPTAAARHAAAKIGAPASDKADTFTIVGTDANGHSITVATVSVTISPSNAAPTGSATASSPSTDGKVSGAVTATDADSDALVYSGTSAKGGTVAFTGANYTYTPTQTARHAAAADGASQAAKEDTITIDVADGYGGVTSITKTVTLTPYNTSPSYTVNKTGLLTLRTITFSGSDGENDTLAYTVIAGPTKGILTPGLLGIYTYVPNNLLFPAADSITVRVTDGHGGSYEQLISLP
jgi:hypothetical protein